MRTAVNVNDDRVFLLCVEVIRLYDTGVEKLTVLRFDAVDLSHADIIVFYGVVRHIQIVDETAAAIANLGGSWHVGAAVVVDEISVILAGYQAVGAVFLGYLHLLAALEIQFVAMTLQRTDLGGGVIGTSFVVEAVERGDHIVAFLNLFCFEGLGVV